MRKLIVTHQENLIECDRDYCDFVIPNPYPNEILETKQFINQPCPKCGDNLLTMKDYLDCRKVERTIIFINKWFSWLTLFFPGKEYKSIGNVKADKGIHLDTDQS